MKDKIVRYCVRCAGRYKIVSRERLRLPDYLCVGCYHAMLMEGDGITVEKIFPLLQTPHGLVERPSLDEHSVIE